MRGNDMGTPKSLLDYINIFINRVNIICTLKTENSY